MESIHSVGADIAINMCVSVLSLHHIAILFILAVANLPYHKGAPLRGACRENMECGSLSCGTSRAKYELPVKVFLSVDFRLLECTPNQ